MKEHFEPTDGEAVEYVADEDQIIEELLKLHDAATEGIQEKAGDAPDVIGD